MPRSNRPQIKDPEMYDALRKEGNSEEKSARISNAAAERGRAQVAKAGGEAGSYDDWTVPELRTRAKELGISGYSGKPKKELVAMLRHH